MRNSAYAIFAGLVVFGGVLWWTRHQNSPSVAAELPPQPSQPAVRQDEHGPSDRVVSAREPNPRVTPVAAVSGATNPDPPPIDISPGFETLLAPAADVAADTENPASIPVRRHRKLQTEARDESWAGRVESDIRANVQRELTAQGADPQRIELSVVECRTSGCEVQAIGYPEDNLKGKDLQLVLPKVMRGVMASDFDAKGPMVMVTSMPDGRLGYIAFLSRKKP